MWPPVQPPPPRWYPQLDTALVTVGALVLAFVAALGHNVTWLVAGGALALLGLIAYGLLENR